MAAPKSVNGSGLDIPRMAAEHLHLDIQALKARLVELKSLEESLMGQLIDLEAMLSIAQRLCNNPGTLSLTSLPIRNRESRIA
jgi:hypothetical protein